MPKQTHGGDDDSEYVEKKEEKIKLSKFGLGPDKNIRDVFWEIVEDLKEKKKIDNESINLAYDQRFTFISIMKGLIEKRSAKKYGLSSSKLLNLFFSFFLEQGWKDAALNLLIEFQEKEWLSKEVLQALKKILKNNEEKERIKSFLKELIRNANFYSVALFYVSLLQNKDIAESVKEELKIFAQGDSIENQIRAIDALGIIKDEESMRVLASLLSNWDVEIRKAAAQNLAKINIKDEGIIEKIKKQIETESDEETRKILQRAVIKWKRS